jgi:DNA-binding transcriptional LysR family regulator
MNHRQFDLYLSFVKVAEHGSFTRAAADLAVTQPALTARIQRLESGLGFELFVRSTRQVTLSDRGKLLLVQAQNLVAELQRTIRLGTELRQGDEVVRIGMVGYGDDYMWRIVDHFRKRYPQISVRLESCPLRLQARHIESGDLDACFTICTGSLEHFEQLLLYRAPVGFLVPANSALAQRRTIHDDDLRRHQIAICDAEVHPETYAMLKGHLNALGIEPITVPDPSPNALVDFARRTGALTCISPDVSREHWTPNDFVFRLLDRCTPQADICLVRRRDVLPNSPVDMFWRVVRDCLANPR